MTTQVNLDLIGVEQCVNLLLIRSMEDSLRFYVDGLGFQKTNQWIHNGRLEWCWLTLGGSTLMLQEVVPAEKYTREFEGRVGQGVSLNFTCRDALAFYRLMKERGIATQRPFVGNRMWVTSLKDPDGYQLHFQSPTDAPEEREYED